MKDYTHKGYCRKCGQWYLWIRNIDEHKLKYCRRILPIQYEQKHYNKVPETRQDLELDEGCPASSKIQHQDPVGQDATTNNLPTTTNLVGKREGEE